MYPSHAATPSTSSRAGDQDRTADEREPEQQRDGRPGDRDPELRARRAEHPAELGDAAEQPERDPLDLHPLPPRLERMAELVQEQRGEEDRRGRECHDDVRAVRETRVLVGEDAGRERPDDQREDDQPRPVDPDLDPGDAAEADAGVHAAVPTATSQSRSVAHRRRKRALGLGETALVLVPVDQLERRDVPRAQPLERLARGSSSARWLSIARLDVRRSPPRRAPRRARPAPGSARGRSARATAGTRFSQYASKCDESKVTTATRPPGESTRRASANAAARSTRWTTSQSTTRSNQPSLNGSDSARASLNATPRGAFPRATASISGDASTPQTFAPARSASATLSRPVPQPTSSTRRPRRSASLLDDAVDLPPVVVDRANDVVVGRELREVRRRRRAHPARSSPRSRPARRRRMPPAPAPGARRPRRSGSSSDGIPASVRIAWISSASVASAATATRTIPVMPAPRWEKAIVRAARPLLP